MDYPFRKSLVYAFTHSGSRKTIASTLITLVLVLSASFAFAQGIVTGSISGTVQDPQGAVVSGAKVTAKQLDTNREYTGETNATGGFSLRVLPPGHYSVQLESPTRRPLRSRGPPVSGA